MRIAIGALALVVAAGTASAAVQSFTVPFNSGVPNVVPGINIVLPKFDTQGGLHILTGVSFSGIGTVQAAIIGINDAAVESTLTVDLSGTLVLLVPGSVIVANFLDSETSPALAPGASHDFGLISDTNNFGPAAGSPLAFFNGAPGDTFAVTGTVTGGFTVSGAGNATIEISNFAALGEVTVEYTFDIIPTPSAAALLGLGGLAVARRRR